ncbi:MAG: WXG100 family type VII secretion target [Clostridia bacterium]|nr:WXG100 family type VII secretion target [Clostridia bacterium]
MAVDINTDEIRRVAKEVKEISGNAKRLSSVNLRNMQSSVEDNLEGDMAKALKKVLSELSDDIDVISRGLESIQSALYKYAERVEEADRKAQEAIKGK